MTQMDQCTAIVLTHATEKLTKEVIFIFCHNVVPRTADCLTLKQGFKLQKDEHVGEYNVLMLTSNRSVIGRDR